MKYALIAIAVAIVAAAGWFFVSPLFIDETVDESFDFVTADGQVDMAVVMDMPEAKRAAMRSEIMTAATSAPDREHMDAMPESGPSVVATGEFVDADAVHKGSGTATLYALPDGRNIVRFEDFRSTNGPALVVYLAKHPSPTSAGDVLDSGFIKLGDLKGNVGNQNYEVPAGTNVDEYGSVVIWCELFDVLFSPAAFERT